MSPESPSLSYFVDGLRNQDRNVLSRAITLVESSRPEDRELAAELIQSLPGTDTPTFRIAVTGVPGAGKSTLIESLGKSYLEKGHSVAVLAIDPSSHLSGGSILGDKTRMPVLSSSKHAFVRPSPTRGALGGLSACTFETILLCEAAGFDLILVETVGVGQAEIEAIDLADVILVVLISGAGDDLQGVKRGILEIADILTINKADGANVEPAKAARSALRGVIGLLPSGRPDWQRTVLMTSASTGAGIDDLEAVLDRFRRQVTKSGYLDRNRKSQRVRRFERLRSELLLRAIEAEPAVNTAIADALRQIETGDLSPVLAARRVASVVQTIIQSGGSD